MAVSRDQWLAGAQLVLFLMICAIVGTCMLGCSNPLNSIARVLESPEMKAAIVETVRDSNKTWAAGARVNDPALRIFFGYAVEVRIDGVSGELEAQGAGGPAEDEDAGETADPEGTVGIEVPLRGGEGERLRGVDIAGRRSN